MMDLIKDKQFFDSLFEYIFKLVLYKEKKEIIVHFIFPTSTKINFTEESEHQFKNINFIYGTYANGITATFTNFDVGMYYFKNWPCNYKFEEE